MSDSSASIPHRIRIVNAGDSALKIEAIRAACLKARLEPDLSSEKVRTGLPAQPEGVAETRRGALARATALHSKHPDAYVVGIENGVRRDGDEGEGWEDWAHIVVITPSGLSYARDTKATPMDSRDVVEALQAPGGFRTNTVGAMTARRLGSPPDDPHSVMTGGARNRASILSQTLAGVFQDIREELDAHTLDLTCGNEAVHVARARDYTLLLPIRTVPTGERVAYFNLRSGRAMNIDADERLGRALRELAPPRTDLVLTPEGKGVTFARFFARGLGVPLIVLGKKNREVDPAADREPYGSRTTAGDQCLYVTVEDVQTIRDSQVSVVVDDVISTGRSAAAAGALARRNGAGDVFYLAVFQEGDPNPGLLDPERVRVMGHLPLNPTPYEPK